MDKKLNLRILDSIRNIVESTDHEVNYEVKTMTDRSFWGNKKIKGAPKRTSIIIDVIENE